MDTRNQPLMPPVNREVMQKINTLPVPVQIYIADKKSDQDQRILHAEMDMAKALAQKQDELNETIQIGAEQIEDMEALQTGKMTREEYDNKYDPRVKAENTIKKANRNKALFDIAAEEAADGDWTKLDSIITTDLAMTNERITDLTNQIKGKFLDDNTYFYTKTELEKANQQIATPAVKLEEQSSLLERVRDLENIQANTLRKSAVMSLNRAQERKVRTTEAQNAMNQRKNEQRATPRPASPR